MTCTGGKDCVGQVPTRETRLLYALHLTWPDYKVITAYCQLDKLSVLKRKIFEKGNTVRVSAAIFKPHAMLASTETGITMTPWKEL